MRLKLFRATTVAEAMAQVRQELGPEALILSTRRAAGGVELAAALESDPAPPPALAPTLAPIPAPAMTPAAPPPPAALVWHGLPASLAARLGAAQAADLARTLRFAPLPLEARARPLLLVGPPGAGKSLTAAKLAARLVLGGTAPLVITTDMQRAGATEQLAAFTAILGLDLVRAEHALALGRALARRPAGAPVLIDTAGADPLDPADRDTLATLAAVADATVLAVLPAGLDSGEAADLAEAYVALGAALLLPTRLDVARRLGGVLAASAAGLALTEAGTGADVATGLTPLDPAWLARRLHAAPGGAADSGPPLADTPPADLPPAYAPQADPPPPRGRGRPDWPRVADPARIVARHADAAPFRAAPHPSIRATTEEFPS